MQQRRGAQWRVRIPTQLAGSYAMQLVVEHVKQEVMPALALTRIGPRDRCRQFTLNHLCLLSLCHTRLVSIPIFPSGFAATSEDGSSSGED
jgi:hypothetical protein